MIHRSKTRNNPLDVFWGLETIIMPLTRHPQKKSFCPMPHSLAPNYSLIKFSFILIKALKKESFSSSVKPL